MSRAQLEATLAKRDVSPEVARTLLDRFEEVGLVDDEAFAAMLVRTRHSERGLVGPALASELTRKGIAPEVAAEAMSQVTEQDRVDAAERIARKRLATTRGLPREVRLRRAAQTLARRGHAPGAAQSTVLRLLDDEPA
jgi:regulatory protein